MKHDNFFYPLSDRLVGKLLHRIGKTGNGRPAAGAVNSTRRRKRQQWVE